MRVPEGLGKTAYRDTLDIFQTEESNNYIHIKQKQ